MPKLSDNHIGDRLHAAIEMIGSDEGETVRGNTALIAARQSLIPALRFVPSISVVPARNLEHSPTWQQH